MKWHQMVEAKHIIVAMVVMTVVGIILSLTTVGFMINYAHRQDQRWCDLFNNVAATSPQERPAGISNQEWDRRERARRAFTELRHELGCI